MLSPFHGRSSCLTTWQPHLADDGEGFECILLPYPLHTRQLDPLSSDPLFLGPASVDLRCVSQLRFPPASLCLDRCRMNSKGERILRYRCRLFTTEDPDAARFTLF